MSSKTKVERRHLRYRHGYLPPGRLEGPERLSGSEPAKHIESAEERIDDFPARIPLPRCEIEVIEAYLGKLLDSAKKNRMMTRDRKLKKHEAKWLQTGNVKITLFDRYSTVRHDTRRSISSTSLHWPNGTRRERNIARRSSVMNSAKRRNNKDGYGRLS